MVLPLGMFDTVSLMVFVGFLEQIHWPRDVWKLGKLRGWVIHLLDDLDREAFHLVPRWSTINHPFMWAVITMPLLRIQSPPLQQHYTTAFLSQEKRQRQNPPH